MQHLRHALTPWRAWLLAAVLLSAQLLGLAHSVAHGGGQPVQGDGWGHAAPHAAAPAAPDSVLHAHHAHAHGDHHGAGDQASAECRLYDQLLGQCHALLSDAVTAPQLAAAPPRVASGVASPGRSAAAVYQARAPPSA